MLRKLLVIGVQVFLRGDVYGYQIQGGLFVFAGAFMLQALAMPYYNAKERYLELLSLGTTMLTMFCGQAIALGGLDEATTTNVRAFVALLTVAVMVVFVVVFFDEVRSVATRKEQKGGGVVTGASQQAGAARENAAPAEAGVKRRVSSFSHENPLNMKAVATVPTHQQDTRL